MESGHINAPRHYLKWTDHQSKAGIGGERLEGGSSLWGAHLPAFRCPECKMLLAHYESNDENAKKQLSGSALTYEQRSDHG
jgi:hypothetical protein